MITIEIYFDDLTVKKQEELLKAYDVRSGDELKDMNWDVFPVGVIEVEDDEDRAFIDFSKFYHGG